MRPTDSAASGFKARVPADDPRYKATVAVPVMNAVDSMPAIYRQCVHEYGYIDVYRAWRMKWTPDRIKKRAEECGGVFTLPLP